MDKVRGVLLGSFIGDALSMPVHWYYNQKSIFEDYNGWITKFESPRPEHPSAIMNVANTGGQGRGNQTGDIIGGVILHDKKQFWGKSKVHYHQGMSAGTNTLNTHVHRVLLRNLTNQSGYSPISFLDDYIKFMTTPNTHPDTYAESYHREFFKNYRAGKPPMECAGAEGHDTASMGGLVSLPALILYLYYKKSPRSDIIQTCLAHISLTHQSHDLSKFARVYLDAFLDFLEYPTHPVPVPEIHRVLDRACKSLPEPFDVLRLIREYPTIGDPLQDAKVVGRMFSPACYISDSLPSLFYFAAKYAEAGIVPALLANTNVGGENCHRGSVLGALLGAALGDAGINPQFIDGLTEIKPIQSEIDAFIKVLE